MDSGSPLILFLIVKLLELIGYLCSIICLPLTLYSLVVKFFINKYDDIKNSKVTHAVLSVPRIVIVLPFFPIAFLGLSFLYGWLIAKALPDHKTFVPYVIALGMLAVNLVGYFFTNHKFPSTKIKFADYFKQVGQAFADLGAIFSLLLSIVTVVRLPFLLYAAFTDEPVGKKGDTVRLILYANMLLIIPDLICLPMLIIVTICHWRFISLKRLRKGRTIMFSFELRILVIFEFFKLFWDIFVLFMSVFLILTPYRIKKAYNRASSAPTWDRSSVAILEQALWGLLDLLIFFLFALFIVPTIYRIYHTICRVFEANTRSGERRFRVLQQIWYIFVDIFILFFMLFLVPTIYRLPILYSKLTQPGRSYRHIIFHQWLKLLRDVPFGIMGLVVLILIWRAPFMIRDLRAATTKRSRRTAIAKHFGWLFVDILDTPFILCSLIILFTVWRAYFFVRGFPTRVSRWVQRGYIMKQFIFLLLDIPTAIGFLILMLTVYRAPTTIKQLKAAKIFSFSKPANTNTNANVVAAVAAPSADDEDNPAPSATISTPNNQSWHQIVGKQFFLLIIDIPFPFLLLMTVWRLPILVGRLKEIDDPVRKYAQRRLLILRYLLLVLFDIICIVPTLVILITMWRVPTLLRVIREYKRGDNEHRELAIVFQKLVVDIPFVLLGLITMIFPWRGIFLVRTVVRDCKTDSEARIMALKYFGIMFVDIISFFCMLVTLVTVWRIRTLVKLLKAELSKPERDTSKVYKWKQTEAVLDASGRTFIFILLDMLGFMQVLVILITVTRVKVCYEAIKKDKETSKEFELHEIRPYLSFYFMESLRDIPHIVFAPVKLVGLLFFPLHFYLSKRTKTPTNSFLNNILIWLHECSINFVSYWEFDKFAVFNIVGGLISIPNEIGITLVGINSVYMFLVTLGSPLWNKKRIDSNWTALGKAQGPMVILEYITVILQAFLFPVFLFMQGILLLLPIIIALGAYNVNNLGFADYWNSFFSDRAFWHDNAKEFSVGVWFAQAFWVLVMAVCWNVTYLIAKKYFILFSPWKAYYWLIKKVFVGRFWGFYKLVLSKSTYVCYRLRRACFIGELLMFPLFLAWTCWPIIIPIVTKIYYIFIPSGLLTGFFIFMSYRIIKSSWGEPIIASSTPKVALTGVFVDIPEDGGITFTFEGQKEPGFVIADAALSLVGDEIWKAIESAMGRTKVRAALMFTGYPISLCPQFLRIQEVNQESAHISFKISIGTAGSGLHLKKKVLVRTVNSIMKSGNPTFDFVVEYGKKDFGWKKLGVLCVYNTSLSIILDAGLDQSDQGAIPIADQHPVMSISAPLPPPPPQGIAKKKPPAQQHGNRFNHNDFQVGNDYDEELQMAIALSMAEVEASNRPAETTQPPASKFDTLRSSLEDIEKIENNFIDQDHEYEAYGREEAEEEEEDNAFRSGSNGYDYQEKKEQNEPITSIAISIQEPENQNDTSDSASSSVSIDIDDNN